MTCRGAGECLMARRSTPLDVGPFSILCALAFTRGVRRRKRLSDLGTRSTSPQPHRVTTIWQMWNNGRREDEATLPVSGWRGYNQRAPTPETPRLTRTARVN